MRHCIIMVKYYKFPLTCAMKLMEVIANHFSFLKKRRIYGHTELTGHHPTIYHFMSRLTGSIVSYNSPPPPKTNNTELTGHHPTIYHFMSRLTGSIVSYNSPPQKQTNKQTNKKLEERDLESRGLRHSGYFKIGHFFSGIQISFQSCDKVLIVRNKKDTLVTTVSVVPSPQAHYSNDYIDLILMATIQMIVLTESRWPRIAYIFMFWSIHYLLSQ